MITVVKAGRLHISGMTDLLNEIIVTGGTTALAEPVDAHDLLERMSFRPDRSAWHVAEDNTGKVMGFQWIQPLEDLPPQAASIATFSRKGHTGLGIGSALFRATEAAARKLGYAWIQADIRTDNEGGLTYYQSRGFETYGTKSGYRMSNGLIVDKVLKRYDL